MDFNRLALFPQNFLERYPKLFKTIALCNDEAQILAIAGDFKKDLLQIIIGYQLQAIRELEWNLENQLCSFQEGIIVLLRYQQYYLLLITYPCELSWLTKVTKNLADSLKKNILLSEYDFKFIEKCQQEAINLVGFVGAILIVEEAKKNYNPLNRELFVEEVAEQINKYAGSSKARLFYLKNGTNKIH
jgi:hypothetical protein